MDFQLHKCSEVVFSVANLQESVKNYTDLMDWNILHKGEVSRSLLDSYRLPIKASANEILLDFHGIDFGRLRLVEFQNVEQKVIRSGGMTWDTGGILDIDLRVGDMQKTYELLRDNGWHGYSDPVDQVMGPFTLQEVVIKGHDEVAIALVHRKNPPMDNPLGLLGTCTNIYLSAMVVKDLAVSADFFVNKIGFKMMNEISFFGEKDAPSMFGIPKNLNDKVEVKLNIIAPTESRDSMLDLVKLDGLEGRDFSENAVPPNRGILMYRFPVTNIEAYTAFVKNNGIKPENDLQVVDLQPFGKIKLLALRSPDGVWIEFFEGI